MGAAIAHQLNEPLTALLHYLSELKEERAHSAGSIPIPGAMREMVDMALLETQRVCSIISRLGNNNEVATGADVVGRADNAIDSHAGGRPTNGNRNASSTQAYADRHLLTPREREVLALIMTAASNKEGAIRLGNQQPDLRGPSRPYHG